MLRIVQQSAFLTETLPQNLVRSEPQNVRGVGNPTQGEKHAELCIEQITITNTPSDISSANSWGVAHAPSDLEQQSLPMMSLSNILPG